MMRQLVQKNSTLRRLYYRAKLIGAKGQSNESAILTELTKAAAHTFVEFGFHPIEFNCAALTRKPDWQGLLVDGNVRQVEDARSIFSSRIKIAREFLTLNNLDIIKDEFPKLGVLSIDVDGNDYWFLKDLIEIKPDVICVEYNSTFGINPITVPYDPAFDRHEKHPSGWYHGASITALANLCSSHGYYLAAVSSAGANAFFTKNGNLSPREAWRPSKLREQYSGIDHAAQWDVVKHLPFERV